ncbi:MAG: uridine monophosphate kinase [Clostridiales bacterium]|jgi:uridylate kinase|nr:uridine monophosphate kinase [Clostridiales bacterium]HOA84860.1 uridine monophosphate kinase [Bacillota bacterium]
MEKPKYKRVLVKLSGEAMQGKDGQILDFGLLERIADALILCTKERIEVAVMTGAGNIWRGAKQGVGMDRCRADQMGMLATVINSIALKDVIERRGGRAIVMTAADMPDFAERYQPEAADAYLREGRIVILGCGTGNSYFSTDTGAVLRAAQLGADIVLMAKNVDGIYDRDPRVYPDAKKYDTVTYDEILSKKLAAYDLTATAFCAANGIKTYAFALRDPMDIYRAACGENIGTLTCV